MIIDDLSITMIVLIGVRLIGFLMFFILFIQKRKVQHLVLAFGWLIYMLGPVANLINYRPNIIELHPLQNLTAASGTYILMLSIILYLRKLSNTLIIILISVFIVPAGILILFLPHLNGTITTTVQGGFLVGILILVLFHRSSIQKSKSNLSFYWLCITLFFGMLHSLGFMMFLSRAPLSLRFAGTFIVNLSLLEFFIYLDWEHALRSLEKSDERFRLLFETAPTPLFNDDSSVLRNLVKEMKLSGIKDIKEYYRNNPDEFRTIPDKIKIIDANSQTLQLFEVSTIEELQENIDTFLDENAYIDFCKSIEEISSNQKLFSFETTIQTMIGKQKEIMFNCSYNNDFFDAPLSMISMVDITEKNQIQKEIEKSLREKEILLQEVHHRVKNNLTIISSILGFQSSNAVDYKTKDVIRSIENRINTMAIVHDHLYRSRNLKEIDFSDYIKELMDGIDASFMNSKKSVTVTYTMEPVYLAINILIPAGMLINEIINNSYKHAFTDIDEPEIQVKLNVKQGKGVLVINDNGKGFDEKSFYQDQKTTGFIIIKALIQQLSAELFLNSGKGTEYVISIPLPPENS